MGLTNARHLIALLALAAAGGSCSEVSVPGRPAWDQHVMPLLQGRCNHCHGETVGKLIDPATGMALPRPFSRMDVCRANTPALQELGIAVTFPATALVQFFTMEFDPPEGSSRPLMPPPPDVPLSDYEYELLKRWVKIAEADATAACQKAVKNRPPQVKLLDPPKETDAAVEARIEIIDPDNEGVLGKATLGSATVDIPGAGRRTLIFPKGTPTGATLGVAVTDGYDIGRL